MAVSMDSTEAKPLQAADFSSGNLVKWCPGCGDYSILAALQSTLAKRGKLPHQVAIVSGIGCSSRLPHYVSTYGFHTIHGRALAVATGVKSVRPEMDVWVITGDGDCLSIGGNHLIHALRRNQDLKILLFNNRIYGLTKGQFSPTTPMGLENKSAPMGTIDHPVHPLALALASEASFVARTADNDPAHMRQVLARAAEHQGAAFVEILQNCVIFYDKAHVDYYGAKARRERLLYLEDGQPMTWGAEMGKGLAVEGGSLKAVDATAANRDRLLVHREDDPSGMMAFMLSRMEYPEYPVPMGVLRAVKRPPYHALLENQVAGAKAKYGEGDLQALLAGGRTWEVA
jgi:2-oxoglutarate ferredoxin oxidoreductase subunit beta